MDEPRKSERPAWVRWVFLGLILLILAAQIVVLWIAPEEKTLGDGIKPVYLHVSLTWTGMLLLGVSLLLGVWVLIVGSAAASQWQAYVVNSGFVIYAVGFVVSMYASLINWGGVPFFEPSVQQALGYLVVGVLLWGASWWFNPPRLKAAVGMLAAGMLLLATDSSQSILHPESPVNTSPLTIRSAFYVMFALGVLLAVWSLAFQAWRSKEN